ncbi:MAG: cytochrome P450 [Actinomycetota bacterium]|nr:cytochrome P450 [Actinomycetota bacterium]
MPTVHPDGAEAAEAAVHDLLFTEEGRQNPYPLYHRLRDVAPVHRSEMLRGMWLLTRYEDCHAVVRDPAVPKRFAESLDGISSSWRNHSSTVGVSRMMLMVDPPLHTRLRRRVARSFTPRRVEALRHSIVAMVGELLDGFERDGGGDVVERIAFTLPVQVIGELLGVPHDDLGWFRDPMLALTQCLELATTREQRADADAAYEQAAPYFADLIAARRSTPADDLLSALAADDGDDPLDDAELVDMALLLFVAGFETTSNLIANAVAAFAAHPDQWELLRTSPGLVEGLATELLRYDTSIQFISRLAVDDVVVGGETIPAGAPILAVAGAANRDPEVYADPDRLDPRRTGARPLSFGAGIHHCLGAALATAEIEVLFGEMARRYPRLELTGPVEYRSRVLFRGPESLEMRVGPTVTADRRAG